MNPALILQIGSWINAALGLLPMLDAEIAAIKAAGSATPDQIAQLDAQIEERDKLRIVSLAEADKALDKAAGLV